MTCAHCGSAFDEHKYELQLRACPECGQPLEPQAAGDATEAPGFQSSLPPRPKRHRLTFTGSAGEFFRIWIVNVFLTIVTLGIYSAWAKVRTRRYFYANTRLAGHGFDYLANPLSILKGHLIVGAAFALYILAQQFAPGLSYVALGAFYLLFPLLVYLSLRFKAHYSAYRNIRFHFDGTIGQAYKDFLFFPFLVPFTLGILYPYVMFRQKRYFFANFAFGTTLNRFYGESRRFYTVYIRALGLSLVGFGVYFAFNWFQIETMAFAGGPGDGMLGTLNMMTLMFLGPLIIILSMVMIQQYVYANITNYAWSESWLGTVRFESTLRTWPLIKLHIGNLLAMVVSLGLLIPWAQVRTARYMLDNLTVITEGDLDSFTAGMESDQNAIGDAAADFFEFDIGL